MYINQCLNNNRRPHTKNRAKKHDIRIPIESELHKDIRYESLLQGITMTQYATAIIEKALSRNYEYEEIPYNTNEHIVHVKLEHSLYTEIVRYAVHWNCSVREATYRVFYNMILMGAME